MTNPNAQEHSEPLEPQHRSVERKIGSLRRGSQRPLPPVVFNDPRTPKETARDFINSLPGILRIH